MLSKNEKIGLIIVNLELFINQLFEKCKNEHEVELLQKQLSKGNLSPININSTNN
jgi:hypothetical protein